MNKTTMEIEKLKKIKLEWLKTDMNKGQAQNLVSKIDNFIHTLPVNFPNSTKYYKKNLYAEINLTDGTSELESFAESNLKMKDNHYFNDGIRHIGYGIDKIIKDLEKDILK
jgi:hypothetical protein